MKRSFTVVVERDPESTWLVGEVVKLPGCYSQAPDLRTLETNMQEAIRANATAAELRDLGLKCGMHTLAANGSDLVSRGETTLDELTRALGTNLSRPTL